MNDNKIYLDLKFMRLFLFASAWAVLGVGLLFVLGNSHLVGFFLTFLGLVSIAIAIYGRALKIGYYSRGRVALLVFSGLLVMMFSFTVKVFFRPPNTGYWTAYFAGTVFLLILSGITLFQSAQKKQEQVSDNPIREHDLNV